MTTGKDIPRDVALKLCDEIRSENKRKRFSIWKLQCWGCYWNAKRDVEKLCVFGGGCPQVNRRYKLQETQK